MEADLVVARGRVEPPVQTFSMHKSRSNETTIDARL
jgi:hypothetical protein